MGVDLLVYTRELPTEASLQQLLGAHPGFDLEVIGGGSYAVRHRGTPRTERAPLLLAVAPEQERLAASVVAEATGAAELAGEEGFLHPTRVQAPDGAGVGPFEIELARGIARELARTCDGLAYDTQGACLLERDLATPGLLAALDRPVRSPAAINWIVVVVMLAVALGSFGIFSALVAGGGSGGCRRRRPRPALQRRRRRPCPLTSRRRRLPPAAARPAGRA